MFLRSSTVRPAGRRFIMSALLAAALASPAHAEVLTLRDALGASLKQHPDLQTFQFRFKAAEAVRGQAGQRPAPELSVGFDNFAGSGSYRGVDEAEATLSLSQVLELGGKRDARLAVADASYASISAERQAAQLDVLAEVTRRFIDVAELQELVTLAKRGTQLAEKTVANTQRRVQAAKAPHVEIDRATVGLGQARLEQRQLESRLDAARQSLSAMWGRDDGTLDGCPITGVTGNIFQLPKRTEYRALVDRLADSPDFLRYASEERLRDAELRLASTRRQGDWTVGGGVRRLQGTDDTAFVATMSIPLFSGSRAESYIAEARAERERVGAERDAALVKAKTQLYALHRALGDASNVVSTLETTAMPRIDEALRETEYAFERGRYGYLELIDAQREYLEIQRTRIEASATAQRLAADIERLTNAPLAP